MKNTTTPKSLATCGWHQIVSLVIPTELVGRGCATGPRGVIFSEHSVVRWRRIELSREIETRFSVRLAECGVGALLHRLGVRRLSARPRHPSHDAAAQERHKKNFVDQVTAAIPEAARGKPVELRWQNEARVGQQGTLTHLWAERSSRPPAPRDCRYD